MPGLAEESAIQRAFGKDRTRAKRGIFGRGIGAKSSSDQPKVRQLGCWKQGLSAGKYDTQVAYSKDFIGFIKHQVGSVLTQNPCLGRIFPKQAPNAFRSAKKNPNREKRRNISGRAYCRVWGYLAVWAFVWGNRHRKPPFCTSGQGQNPCASYKAKRPFLLGFSNKNDLI